MKWLQKEGIKDTAHFCEGTGQMHIQWFMPCWQERATSIQYMDPLNLKRYHNNVSLSSDNQSLVTGVSNRGQQQLVGGTVTIHYETKR